MFLFISDAPSAYCHNVLQYIHNVTTVVQSVGAVGDTRYLVLYAQAKVSMRICH